MINLSKSGDTIVFEFINNGHYLENGTIEVPVNSLSLVTDSSNMCTFYKADSNDAFISATYDELGKTKAEMLEWYEENMVDYIDSGDVQTQIDQSISGFADSVLYNSTSKYVEFYNGGTGGTLVYEFDASDFVIDGMVDDVRIETISGVSYLVIDFNTASGKEDIQIPLTDIFNPDNYYTKTEVDGIVSGKADSSAVTQEISAAVSGRVDTSAFETYSGSVETALSGKQDTLSAGTNITIVDNVISATGGGGKAVSGGTNISITTGETADTINCTLPITATTDTTNKAIMIGQSITASNTNNGCVIIGSAAKGTFRDVIIGNKAKNNGDGWNDVVAIGAEAKGYSESVAIGSYTETYNGYKGGSVAIGYNARAKNMKDAVAIGYGVSTTGTTKTNINNQLKIDSSNQVYIYNKDNTEMICLQDQLGGGGSSYSAGTGIDITNDVISVSGVVMSSAITTTITSGSTDAQVPSAKAVYDTIGNINSVLNNI